MNTAEQLVEFAYSHRDDGLYSRPRESDITDFGGRMISSSVWEFQDGSRVEVVYSGATVCWFAAAGLPDGDGEWSTDIYAVTERRRKQKTP